MPITVKAKSTKTDLARVLQELQEIKKDLQKFLFLIPQENINEYKNIADIKGAYSKAMKLLARR
ncbi:MAG: hypothetical protein A2945_01460 [Candidatus Liptonbacteria bacterium RIFCSPLOWO2_01_FULL_52_25]|uniref:Uncharacterized protein n=1 Tax=Candidatus Liptonbacteria bacterium RIFCSPLOWO2_01_FULL_52_25 TaxID=1798650 RepID=A0A1G2CE49_9BACT|nr:MAG: hypothetical protein A2945_01460 [Candidatus Liptonbacteria bacterium RIFCSPLOWO2_01_FULL_52_25]